MAMFLFCNRVLVILLIKFLLILCENGLLTKGKATTVNANGNMNISGPFIQIEKPTITRLIITKPHQSHYLMCIATIEESYYQNETDYFYTWFRNGNMVETLPQRNQFSILRNGTLRLPPMEKSSGVYRCKINANTTAVLSGSITVEYPVLKRIPAKANITGVEGLSLTFNCPVISVPQANVSWFYGNVSLSKNFQDNRFLILANGSLVLRKLTLKDDGKYKCFAQNQFAAKTHRQFMWTLRIERWLNATDKSLAKLVPYLQNSTQYIPSGSDLKLLCYGYVKVKPIEWWFQRDASVLPVKVSNDSNEFYIRNASSKQHEGFYNCSTKHDSQRYRVIVTTPPTIVQELRSYETLITASTKFQCSATGNPKPVYSWYHNGVPLNSSYTRYINGNELLIHSFDPDEDGIYQCFARNIAGEAYSAAELRFRNKGDGMLRKNPLDNIRCFPHSLNTINVTFDSKSAESLIVVHIVESNPHRWKSFAPMQLNHTSYVIISSYLPVYRPFQLITRVLFPTSDILFGNKPQYQTILSSLRSPSVTCCTQGLVLHLVHLANDTFVTWSQPDLNTKKYFILQFSINYTHPHPQQLLEHALRGTTQHVELSQEDVAAKLTHIKALTETAARAVLKGAEGKYIDNEARASQFETDEDVFNLVVTANVTGILLQNFSRIKIRVLIITTENENLEQDFRYVQWKIIENDTTESTSTPFRLTTVESRMLVFHFQNSFNETCIHVCHWQIQFPIINKEEQKCAKRNIVNSQVEIRELKPTARYRLNFFSCENHILFEQLDAQTLPDPPGTISNQRVTRHNGLKLNWDPPEQPNGKIHHYNILWSLGNVTHEANVMECSVCFYKFPNISETAKINVTVRVVGETGVGAPIFIDLRNINHQTLEVESSSSNSEVYSGIAIGSLLSTFCVFCFALLIIFQRRRFKARQQGPTHLTSPSDMNFGNLNNPNIPGDSAGGLSSSTFQPDYHEMQTLIPKTTGRHIEFHAERPNEYQTTQLPNGNGRIPRVVIPEHHMPDPNTTGQSEFDDSSAQLVHNISQVPLCRVITLTSSPPPPPTPQEAHSFFKPFKLTPPNTNAALQKHKQSSLTSFQGSGSGGGGVVLPPTTLPLVATLPGGNTGGSGSTTAAHRSGSLSNSSAGSSSRSSSNSSKKQFHTNFPKHCQSNDGICLLADEESAATLTPTSETEVTDLTTTPSNGFKVKEEQNATPAAAITIATPLMSSTPTSTKNTSNQTNYNNNNAKLKTSKKPSSSSNRIPTTTTPSTQSSSNTSKVPAIGQHPLVAASTSSTSIAVAAKHWPTATATQTKSTAATVVIHRRPNVDPNG